MLRGPKKSFANVPLCGALVVVTASVTLRPWDRAAADPQEHTLVFLEPGLLGAVSELLFFLFSSCLLSSMFKAVCAFIFAQLQDPFGPALSPFLAVPERGHHSLLMPPTFPPISSFVRDLWSCCKSHLSFPLSRICHPVGSTFDSSVTEKTDGAALLFRLHSKITGT